MLFEGSRPGKSRAVASETDRRSWCRVVQGQSDFWVVVVPDSEQPTEWLYREDAEVSPLRFCHTIRDDDVLVMGDSDLEDDEMFSDLLGML